MTKLGWSYDQFMDSTLYFYFGIAQQWAINNGAKSKKTTTETTVKNVTTFDQLPAGYW